MAYTYQGKNKSNIQFTSYETQNIWDLTTGNLWFLHQSCFTLMIVGFWNASASPHASQDELDKFKSLEIQSWRVNNEGK